MMSAVQSTANLETNLDPLLSRRETSRQIGVSVRTLERAIAAGAVVPVRIATRVLIRSSDVESIQRNGLAI